MRISFDIKRINRLFTPFALVLIVGLLLYGRLLAGQTIFLCDVLAYQLPEKFLIRQSLIAGHIPFLNPFILSGTLFYANMDAGTMNPMNMLLLVGNQIDGFNLFVFFHYVLAILAMYFLLNKGLGHNKWIGLTGAIAYGSGYLWSMSGNGFFRCGFLIPLFFLSIIMYLGHLKEHDSRDRRISLVFNVIILALMFYCGNFLEVYFSILFAGIMIVYQIYMLFLIKRGRYICIMLIDSVLALGMAFLLATPVLLPAVCASLGSYRSGGIPIVEAQQWSFPPVRLIEYLVPYIFGARQCDGSWYAGIYNVEETFSKTGLSPWADFIYIGIPLVLGFYVFLRSKKDWTGKFIIFALFAAFLLALGKFTPLYKYLYFLLPGFNMFRHPEKFLFWVNFWLILGGCAGLKLFFSDKDLVSKQVLFLIKVLASILGCLAICLLCLFLFMQEPFVGYIQAKGSMLNGDEIFLWEGFTIGLSLFITLVVLAIIHYLKHCPSRIMFAFFIVTSINFVLWHNLISWTIPSESLKKVETWDARLPAFDKSQWRIFYTGKFLYPVKIEGLSLKDEFMVKKLMEYSTLDCNTPTIRGIRTASGFSPVMDRGYVSYMNFDRHDPERVLDMLSVRYIAIHKIPDSSLPVGTRIIGRDEADEFVFLENTDALPRVGTCPDFILTGKGKADEEVFDKNRNIHENIVLEELPVNYDRSIACSKSSMAEIIDENTNHIKIKVKNGPCWLVVRDWFNQGWTCKEAGTDLQIVKADGGVMAVFCHSKEGILEFKYFPPGLKLGILLMILGLALLVSYGIFYKKLAMLLE